MVGFCLHLSHIRIFLALDDLLLVLLDLFLFVVPFGSAAGTVKGRATGAQSRESLGRTILFMYEMRIYIAEDEVVVRFNLIQVQQSSCGSHS